MNCTHAPDHKYSTNFLMGNIRELCYKSLENNRRPFIVAENSGSIKTNSITNKFIYYYQQLCRSKFCLAPPNFVPDTYRIWDCLYMGCIPIILDFEGSSFLKDLPILFIDNYKKFLTITEDELNEIWLDMINKEYNFDKLNISYIEKMVKDFII